MWFQIKSYLRFLWRSKNEHGVHSPFVFRLVTQCFYDPENPQYGIWSNYRQALLQNPAVIEVTDFGSGSKVFKSSKRQVRQIAKKAGIPPKRAELLLRLCHYFQPQNVLEIGTSLGLSTAALSLGHPGAHITTLEGCPATASVAEKQFKDFKLDNISLINGTFSAYLNKLSSEATTFDLIYFDGNHSQEATLDYFDTLLPTSKNDSVWVFDDIHWSEGMEKAWEMIKNHPQVTVTVDTFYWGLVFFRKEQQKEHFSIRV